MRLSRNEIRARVAVFAEEWLEASYEKGETQSFYNDFFDVFGIRCASIGVEKSDPYRLTSRWNTAFRSDSFVIGQH